MKPRKGNALELEYQVWSKGKRPICLAIKLDDLNAKVELSKAICSLKLGFEEFLGRRIGRDYLTVVPAIIVIGWTHVEWLRLAERPYPE